MKYDDYEDHYRMPFQTPEEAQALGDLHYEQDQIDIELNQMMFQGNYDAVEADRLQAISTEYDHRIETIMVAMVKRQHDALVADVEAKGIDIREWYFVDLIPEWMGRMDIEPDSHCYKLVVADFRKTVEMPDTDVTLIDAARFPSFMHAVLVRGDSAFHCRMLGREISPVIR